MRLAEWKQGDAGRDYRHRAAAGSIAKVNGIDYGIALTAANPMAKRPQTLDRALVDVLAAADRAGTRVVLIGGMARNAYTRPRMTDDIDLLIASIEELDRLLKELAATCDVPAVAAEMVGVRHRKSGTTIDLLVADYDYERDGIAKALETTVAGRKAFLVPLEVLIAMKIDAAGDPTRVFDFAEAVALILLERADLEIVEQMLRRERPKRLAVLEAAMASAERVRVGDAKSGRGRQRYKDE